MANYKDISLHDKVILLEAEIELCKSQIITVKEAHLIREWFDHIEDTSIPEYIINADGYDLAAKIYKICGRKLRGSIKRGRL